MEFRRTLIGLFKDEPLELEPGERWSYNNSAYVLLGAVIEKVWGRFANGLCVIELLAAPQLLGP